MKFSSTLITAVVVLLFACGQQVQGSNLEADSLKKDNQQKQTIILVDVIQPLLFGKVGVGVGWQTIKREYLFYGNYVFGKGTIPTTAFKIENKNGGSFDDRVGFDVGFQLKMRSELLGKPYKDYVKDVSSHTNLYTAVWYEISNKSGSKQQYSYYSPTSYDIWEFKIGGLLGWSISPEKSNMLFDINLGLGGGVASGRVFYDQSSLPPGSRVESEQVSSLILLYKISFQIGFKL